MREIVFVKEPGYTRDLMFLFILYFNSEYLFQNLKKSPNHEEVIAEMQTFLDEITPIPEELRPLFYCKENNVSFITMYYFVMHSMQAVLAFQPSVLCNALQDQDRLLRNLLSYYFPQLTQEEQEQCLSSFSKVAAQIKHSNYSSDLKSDLYGIFLEPAHLIQTLTDELLEKEIYLSKKYEEHSEELKRLQQSFNEDGIEKLEKFNQTGEGFFDSFEKMYVSFEICNKAHVFYQNNDSSVLLILGDRAMDLVESFLNPSSMFDFSALGTALSEQNRVDILNLLYTEKELPLKTICETLHITSTNAYYHLNLMLRCGMLATRRKSKTLLYRIETSYFKKACDILGHFAKNESVICKK